MPAAILDNVLFAIGNVEFVVAGEVCDISSSQPVLAHGVEGFDVVVVVFEHVDRSFDEEHAWFLTQCYVSAFSVANPGRTCQ